MQVVLLCGGQGTRIRDVTEDIPKPMIPIGGLPILWHIMKVYAQFGHVDFILCLGYKSWAIKRYFLEYHLAHADLSLSLGDHESMRIHGQSMPENWHVTLAETGLETMTGGRLKRIEKYIRGDTFLMSYGDGLADVNLHDLVACHHRHGKLATVTAVRPPGRFGEIELQEGRVIDFSEKPVLARGYINGGFFVFNRAIFKRLSKDPGLILEQAPLVQLARAGELMAYPHHGFWHPMDSSRDFRYLNDLWDQGRAPWRTWSAPILRAAA